MIQKAKGDEDKAELNGQDGGSISRPPLEKICIGPEIYPPVGTRRKIKHLLYKMIADTTSLLTFSIRRYPRLFKNERSITILLVVLDRTARMVGKNFLYATGKKYRR